MLHALASDWAQLTDWKVFVCWDARLGECEIRNVTVQFIEANESFLEAWKVLANDVDYVLVIAPEIDNQLVQIINALRACGARMLNADSVFLEAASDKWKTSLAFQRANVRHPRTQRLTDFISQTEGMPLSEGRWTGTNAHPDESRSSLSIAPHRWTIKPRDGAGCHEVMRFESLDEVRDFIDENSRKGCDWDRYLIQPWIEGISASVAVLCGPRQLCVLPAMLQKIELDPKKSSSKVLYTGGEGPFHGTAPEMLNDFASRVIRSLPGAPVGWVGIDLIVDNSKSSEESMVAIEINPRLTTSYLGVREIISENPAKLLFQVASGLEIGFFASDRTTTFDSFGTHLRD